MRNSTSRIVIGSILLLVGIGWLLESAGFVDVPFRLVLPCVLIVIGIVLAVRSFTGHAGGLVIAGAVISIVLAAGGGGDGTFFGASRSVNIGHARTYRPVTGTDLRSYRIGSGRLTIDLRKTTFDHKKTYSVEGHVGAGDLIVIVPSKIPVHVESHAGVGKVVVFGRTRSNGVGNNDEYESPDYSKVRPRLNIELHAGAGTIRVERGTS